MNKSRRLNFLVSSGHGFLVVRPIGHLTVDELVDAIIDAYKSVDAPWTYNRIIDFRRFKGDMSNEIRDLVAQRWAEMTADIEFHAYVALVFRSPHEKFRVPERAPPFPKETLCYFTDYHEAVGWILADDGDLYLANLPDASAAPRGGYGIIIE